MYWLKSVIIRIYSSFIRDVQNERGTWGYVAVAGATLVSGVLNANAKSKTGDFSAQANTTPGSPQQVQDAYTQSQQGLQQQNNLVNALNNQNGIQNQSNVYNQLGGVANGTGPNPAQAMLNNQTGQNVANQAALMAGQRGASSNVGLLARQAGQQGANTQQQAVGQGAALQAQQSLNALGQQSGIAANQVTNQLGATQALNQAQQGEQGQLLGNQQANNANAVNYQNAANATNAGLQNQQNQFNANQSSNLGGALGSAARLMTSNNSTQVVPTTSSVDLTNASNNSSLQPGQMNAAEGGLIGPRSKAAIYMKNIPQQPVKLAQGGKVPAMVSPGEKYLNPRDVQKVKQGTNPMRLGETIPGKAKVSGAKNDYANDTVPKTLDEGGIVLPRSVTQAKHPHWEAHKFVAAIMKQNALKGKK